MKWSARAGVNLTPNRLTEAIRAVGAGEPAPIDLTVSNPTAAGFAYPPDLLARLADPRALVYRPSARGLPEARAAVAADYGRRRLAVAPERIVLTSSTSEAYSLLFKLLCDPGDEVLVPHPSYPLFEHLARLDAVVLRPYQLEYHARWSIDFASVERAWSPRTKAVLMVSPNNPTGSFISPAELTELAALGSIRDAALIVDEVFADYELTPGAAAGAGRALEVENALVFSLGGLSKSIGLPQAKLAWIAVAGPDSLTDSAIERLEFAADTYLSVSTPVQLAASDLLERGSIVRAGIQERICRNYRDLVSRIAEAAPFDVLRAEGGWYAVVRVPSIGPEEDLVVSLVARDRVVTHPGYFFDFPAESYLVISLLVPEPAFAEGVSRVLRHFDCTVARR